MEIRTKSSSRHRSLSHLGFRTVHCHTPSEKFSKLCPGDTTPFIASKANEGTRLSNRDQGQ
jgi:hypothetical protein